VKKNILAMILMTYVLNAHSHGYTGNFSLFVGQKSLDSEDWAPIDDQATLGLLADFKHNSWPVSLAIDYLGSYDEAMELGLQYEAITTELGVGVRKYWETPGSSLRPYIGAGLAYIYAEARGSGFGAVPDGSDHSPGFLLNGGIFWTLGDCINVGLGLRYSNAEVTIFDVKVDAGGTSAGLIFGCHW
jgi:hypothetical protein